ncbi:ribonuclease E/G [Planktotalea sp.]|uniref:ribonuclease E/G n=1 Tax=Planktotalea sp. TaxID=2029877 RepID=UPI0025E47BA8|nr:ribonuclease E/G [Planktotalea sp.]
MIGRTIILDHFNGREAAALMVDGKLEDLLIASDAPAPGTIYRAIADRPVKGQGGMFLKTPDGNAFLRQIKGMALGDELLVQVTGYAEDGKAIPVQHRVLFKSRYVIVTPNAPGINVSRSIRDEDRREEILAVVHDTVENVPHGIILRSSCENADAEDIAEDLLSMLTLTDQVLTDEGTGAEMLIEGDAPHLLAWRDWVEPADVITEDGGFETHGVMDAIEALESPRLELAGGAYAYVEPTRALIAVDVNTGNDTSMTAGTKANFALAKALPRDLRVRGLGGQIVLDLAPMSKKDRRGFESALKAALRNDTIETVFVGWTPLGHVELQRKRARLPLTELLK